MDAARLAKRSGAESVTLVYRRTRKYMPADEHELALALAELVYTLIIFATGHPVAGWTTTMFVITVGFAGLFAVLTIVVKYLCLLLNLNFRQQKYLVESIEKLQK